MATNLATSITHPVTAAKSGDFLSLLGEETKIRMRDPLSVRDKVSAIINDGHSKLQVISDFDYTMSRFEDGEGKRCWTTHTTLEKEAHLIAPQLGEQLDALKEKFMKIEFCPDMTKEEKTPHMVEWWTTAHELLVSAGFRMSNLQHSIKSGNICLREGCAAVVKDLNRLEIPLVIFSAGIGDIIRWVFQHHPDFSNSQPRYHLVSNLMRFNEEGILVGFHPPLVHTFNKNESVVSANDGLASLLSPRHNVILLGDSLGDVHMDVGCSGHHLSLKIGFLNFNVESLLPSYLNAFDIVLVEEPSWNIVRALLKDLETAA